MSKHTLGKSTCSDFMSPRNLSSLRISGFIEKNSKPLATPMEVVNGIWLIHPVDVLFRIKVIK